MPWNIPSRLFLGSWNLSIPEDVDQTSFFRLRQSWRTSIFRSGPTLIFRFCSSTGTAERVSNVSAPSLCFSGEGQRTVTSLEWCQRTLRTASISISIPCCFATSHAWRSSSLVPHRVSTAPFWSNSPKSHWWCVNSTQQINRGTSTKS